MRRASISLFLCASIGFGAAVAACGTPHTPENGYFPPTPSGTAMPSATPSATASAAPSATTSAPPLASGDVPPANVSPPAPAKVEMHAPEPTKLADKLKAIGLDVKKLPPLEKIEAPKLRKVMDLFNEALGTDCTDCHVKGQFSAPTKRKNIAGHMWNDFVRVLQTDKAQPVFCDSCHQGKLAALDRTDKAALAKWMDKNYQEKLALKSGKGDVSCATCHGDDTAPPFLEQWGKSWSGSASK